MTATDETLVLRPGIARAEGIELLGDVHGSGYEGGAALVRRADGQVVQLGPLCDEEHVEALAEKLAAQGLLAGHEQNAPPRRNPLLALRWKVLVTDPKWTSRLTAPFTFLYQPFVVA